MILDQHGNPLSAAATVDEAIHADICPFCGANGGFTVLQGFGGYWHIVCKCGNKVRSGRGEAPVGR